MTDVNKSKLNLISTRAEALALYAAPPAEFANKVGMEVEMGVLDLSSPDPRVPSADEMAVLQNKLKACGYDAQLEPAGVLEYASGAVPATPSDVAKLVADIKKDVAVFTNEVESVGFTRSPYSIAPSTTEQDALSKIASRPRLQVSIQAMQDIFPPNTLRLPLLTAGVQTSFSPANADDMLSMMYRAYALTPLLMASTNSFSGYIVNEDEKIDYLPRAQYYLGYGPAGGISGAFLNSETGAELTANHIDAVFKAPMHFAYDLEGNLFPASKENPITFEKLIAMGYNTQSNFELAETFLYNDVKICNLRNGAGDVVGKRLEVRGADSGYDQPVMAMLMTAAVVPAGPGAEAFDALLKDYGFTGSPKNDAALFLEAREATVNHKGKFMDVAFGRDPETGAPRTLRDFAADVAGILVSVYGAEKSLSADVSRACDILLTGQCDAKVFADSYPTLEAATTALWEYAPAKNTRPATVPGIINQSRPKA